MQIGGDFQPCGISKCPSIPRNYLMACGTTATSSSSSTTGSNESKEREDNIIYGVVFGVVGAAVITAIAIFIIRKRRHQYHSLK